MGAPQISQIGQRPSLEEALRLYNGGNVEVAQGLLEAIVEAEPLNVDALVALGHCHWRVFELQKAQQILEKALAIQPTNIMGLRALGLTMYTLANLERAKEVLLRCVKLAPDSHQAWLTLGLVEQRQENIEKAEAAFRKALEISPNYAEAMNNLGTIYLTQRNYSAARDLFLQAIREKPDLVDAYRSLSKLLRELGSDQEALVILKRALRIAPKDANGWNDLGGLYRDLMDTSQSIAAYRQAIEIDPKHIDAKGNLSCILANDGDFKGAKDLCTEILQSNPDMMGVRFRRAIVIPAIMDTVESIEESRETLHNELDDLLEYNGTVEDPLGQIGSTNFYLAYHGFNDRELQKKQAEMFLKVTPSLHFEARHIGRKRRGGRIRLGICSRHLAFHTIGILWAEMFAGLDRDTFEISLFHTQPVLNRMSQNLVERIDHEVRLPLDLAKSQKAIADHELDILYYPDLGMEPLTYFLAFSRLAPTQCVSWGHPLTTGISTIDYFVSSKELEIPTAQSHYTEELIRLDTLNTFYLRPEVRTTLTRASLGVKESSTLYMCPQTLFKFHPDFDSIIHTILEGDPNGELVLLEGTCANHTTLIRQRLQRTIPNVLERIRIIPRLSHDGFLALVKMADVMLDPIHFGGGSTTIQALSFGTPVVTLPSEFLRGRISYACYRHMEVNSLIAKDASDYCRIAVELGRTEELRRGMRTELAEKSGVLFSNPRVIQECKEFLEGAFKKQGGR
jgi:predicted O-linked N-acetylglucosamine transferase (SPINDLY family)